MCNDSTVKEVTEEEMLKTAFGRKESTASACECATCTSATCRVLADLLVYSRRNASTHLAAVLPANDEVLRDL
jgi:hypothetical protein